MKSSPSKRLPYDKPTKPASGYNIYYRYTTMAARNREIAERLYMDRVLLRKPSGTPTKTHSSNKTKQIAQMWLHVQDHTKDMFTIRSRDDLEVYHVRKSLWGARTQFMQPKEEKKKMAQQLQQRTSDVLAISHTVATDLRMAAALNKEVLGHVHLFLL